MAEILKIDDKVTKIKFSNNVLYYFAFGTMVVFGERMHIKFFNGVEQHFTFSQFTTIEPDFESYIDSLVADDYFRVNTTGGNGGGGGGDASAANQLTQITEAQSTNTKLDTLIANNATAALQTTANAKLDSIISALSGLSTEAKQDNTITVLNSLLTELQLKADLTETQPVSVAVVPLPTGAATSALQTTGNTSLSSIDTKIPADPATVTKQNEIIAAISGGSTPLPAQPDRDSFGALRVSNAKSLIDLKQVGTDQPLFWDRETIGGGTSVYTSSTSSSLLSVTNNLDAVIVQSFQHLHYQSGKGQKILCTFRTFQAQTNVTKRVGYYTSTETTPFNSSLDGIYFESTGSGISVNIANNGTVNSIAQASWNLDTLDGTGASGITIDFSKRQIGIIDFQWLSVGRVRIGFVIDGAIYYVHQFNHANSGNEGAYMRTPHKPVRYEIRSTGGSGSFEQICASVESESGQQVTGVLRSLSSAADLQCSATSQYAIYGLRLKSGFYSEVNLIDITMINENNDNFFWRVLLNPTVTGTFAYNNLADSALQTAVSDVATPATCTGGIEIASGIQRATLQAATQIDNAIKLGTSIAGVKDEIVLAYQGITTGSDVFATISWREYL